MRNGNFKKHFQKKSSLTRQFTCFFPFIKQYRSEKKKTTKSVKQMERKYLRRYVQLMSRSQHTTQQTIVFYIKIQKIIDSNCNYLNDTHQMAIQVFYVFVFILFGIDVNQSIQKHRQYLPDMYK